MGRSPCCEKVGLKKGPWTHDEDQKLLAYIQKYGHGSWRDLPTKAGLQRCGKSCRLRWTNYLRPDIKRGKFSLQEEQTIIQLHALLGNRWSTIATHLSKRTDNEIKNYWNTHLKKRLSKMGIDPMTHKPKINPLGSNLSHMAQWETARLEAEARLVRRSNYTTTSSLLSSPLPHHFNLNKPQTRVPPSLDMLKDWQETWTKPPTVSGDNQGQSYHFINPVDENDMFVSSSSSVATQSRTTSYATFNFSDQNLLAFPTVGFGNDNLSYLENSYEGTLGNSKTTVDDIMQLNDNNVEYPNGSGPVTDPLSGLPSFIHGFTELFPENIIVDDAAGNCGMAADTKENKSSYWNSVLNNLVASPVGSPVF